MMSPTRRLTEITIFLSSPNDVSDERDAASRVADELNRTLARAHGFVLRVVRWDRNVIPAPGRPQGVINEQVGAYQVFVGILWARFGTPTGVAAAGTEEEFDIAFERWSATGEPWIMFYFCERPLFPDTDEAMEQFQRVVNFKRRVSTLGLTKTFSSTDEFERLIREHLTGLIIRHFGSSQQIALPENKEANPPQGVPIVPAVASRDVGHFIDRWKEKVLGGQLSVGLNKRDATYITEFLASHTDNIDRTFFGKRKFRTALQALYPLRRVAIRTFYLARYPVTNRLFQSFVDATTYTTLAELRKDEDTWLMLAGPNKSDHPVRGISFVDAQAFCRWAGVRLPTSDEFECAVRGSDGRLFPWGHDWEPGRCNDIFWVADTDTSAVGQFPQGASRDGLLDLCGNVFEWVMPSTEVQPGVKALAGGSFTKIAVYRGNASARILAPEISASPEYGFRYAVDIS